MKYIFRSIRFILGYIIIAIDWLTRPRRPEHTPETKARLDQATSSMALYQFRMCPFCVRTRRTVRKLGLDIELRDARNDPQWNTELVNEGGRYQVPCLRIEKQGGEVEWIYDSTKIRHYLERRFARK